MDLLKIFCLTFSSLLCNFCILLFTHPALPYPHFLPLSNYILPSSPTLASTVFPLPLPHLLSLYNPCIATAWANVSTHLLSPSLPFSHLLSNPAVARRSGESWDYLTHLPRDKCTHSVHTHVFVTSKHHLGVLFYSSLCSLERTVVINLPLFKKLCELELLIMEISLHITGLFSELWHKWQLAALAVWILK